MLNTNTNLWMIFLLLVTLVHITKAEITCQEAVTKIFPCEPFMLGATAVPIAQCCEAANELDKIVSSSQSDRRTICECFKTVAQMVPLNLGNAKQIPQLCKLSTTIPIDPTIDCNRI